MPLYYAPISIPPWSPPWSTTPLHPRSLFHCLICPHRLTSLRDYVLGSSFARAHHSDWHVMDDQKMLVN